MDRGGRGPRPARGRRLLGGLAAVVVLGLGAVVYRAATTPRAEVLIFGDSLVFDASAAFESHFGARDVRARFGGFPGTGVLFRNGAMADRLSEKVAEHDPDIVVLQSCCNYNTTGDDRYVLPDGSEVEADSETMYVLWAEASQDWVDRAGAGGAEVFWALSPPLDPGLEALNERVDRLNGIYLGLDGVTLIDWPAAVALNGFTATRTDDSGAEVRVRHPDGIHFTPEGSQLLVEATWNAIEPAI